jgi:pyruvate dehydrogenase E2 component (dihydrolipoamide acetyltransferase)
MPHNVVMPQLGLTMTEGSVSAWLKKTGDRVEKGEALFTVETDKVEMEVESTVPGYVGAIIVEPQHTVPTGTVIAVITDKPGEAVVLDQAPSGGPEAAGIQQASGANGAPPKEAARTPAGEFAASPRAKRLATELGVDLQHVKPARGSRITEEDVRRFHETSPKRAVPGASARRVVAERMAASFQTAPHFYLGVEVNATELVNFRDRMRARLERDGVRLTYTDILLKALATALREHPAVNSWWKDGEVVRHDSVDVGVAVQTESRLLVPVIRNADRLDFPALSMKRQSLAETARSGRLTLADIEGGSATLSNLGQFGIDWFQAILNPPQSVIVAAGRIAKRPVVNNDRVEVCPSFTLTLAADHRVIDGVAAAQFLSLMKKFLEYPPLMMT